MKIFAASGFCTCTPLAANQTTPKIGIINVPECYDAGKSEYFASSSTLIVIESILLHYVELKNPDIVNHDLIFKQYTLPKGEVCYPLASSTTQLRPTLEAKEKELANDN